MYFGTRDNLTRSFALLDYFVEHGGTFVDSANIYAALRRNPTTCPKG
jgi:aryl-alcohol dehydrogenase-like predicted oxidoreductase